MCTIDKKTTRKTNAADYSQRVEPMAIQSTADYPLVLTRFSNKVLTSFRRVKPIDINLSTASSPWFSRQASTSQMFFGRFANSFSCWPRGITGVIDVATLIRTHKVKYL